MYKSLLHEMCQQRRWAPPVYQHTRVGLDHVPLFRATVAVNGAEFQSPEEGTRSAKEACNLAAMAAFESLSALPASPAPPPPAPDPQLPLKTQLQIYCQKRGKQLPSYRPIQKGQTHPLQFKSVVTVDGQSFDSPQFCRTLREAEAAAAKVALMSLPQEASPLEQSKVPSISYKNVLQELAQKEGFPLPKYSTASDVQNHTGTFQSTVEIQGKIFHGEGSTKKQAEMNAAKVAFQHFKDSKGPRLKNLVYQCTVSPAIFEKKNDIDAVNHDSHTLGSAKILPHAKIAQPLDENTQSAESKANKPPLPAPSIEVEVMDSSLTDDKLPLPAPSTEVEVMGSSLKMEKLPLPKPSIEVKLTDSPLQVAALAISEPSTEAVEVMGSSLEVEKLHLPKLSIEVKLADSSLQVDAPIVPEPSTEADVMDSSFQVDEHPPIPKPSLQVEEMDSSLRVGKHPSSPGLSTDAEVMNSSAKHASTLDGHSPPTASIRSPTPAVRTTTIAVSSDGCGCYMLTNRIQVYPRNPDLIIPEGATILPISDDEWVAVSLPFSNNGGNRATA